jgi:hypothetical protein
MEENKEEKNKRPNYRANLANGNGKQSGGGDKKIKIKHRNRLSEGRAMMMLMATPVLRRALFNRSINQ